MINRHLHVLFTLVFVFLLSACDRAEEPIAVTQAPQSHSETWPDFIDRQIEEHIAAHPQWAVVQGRHEYDGQLPDWSRAGIEKEIARLHRARNEALAFPSEQLDEQQLYQREYFISRVDQDLFWAEKAGWPFRNPEYYFGWLTDSLDPSAYITLDYAPIDVRMRAFTRYLQNVPRAVGQIRENLAMPMPRTWLQLGIDSF
ncbi:MAG: DUF885 family protein, partial [Xanthomonadales bacterium]|nr:DUF885 family protein [Xanthomonadales bacterium]